MSETRWRTASRAVTALLLGTACSPAPSSPAAAPSVSLVAPASTAPAPASSELPPSAAPDASTIPADAGLAQAPAVRSPPAFDLDAAKASGAATTRLAFDLYAHLATGTGNTIYSPASIAAALAQTAAGARGETRDEMLRVLHANALPDADGAYAALLASINGRDGRDAVELHTTSRLWGQTGLEIRASFLQGPLGASFGQVDFEHDPSGACTAINSWVAGETHDRIPVIFERCTRDMVLVLANAIYFRGKWETPFKKELTTDRNFFTMSGDATHVPTMAEVVSVSYAHLGGVQVVSLPYRGGLSMLIALPDDRRALSTVERELAARHRAWLGALETHNDPAPIGPDRNDIR